MRILFLRHPMQNIGGTGIYTKLIIEELVTAHHTVGLWPADHMVYENLYRLPIVRFAANTLNLSGEWDIVLIQNAYTLMAARRFLRQIENVPHVFISHSSLTVDQIFPYPQLAGVIMIADAIENSWGIPQELVCKIPNPIRIPPLKKASATRREMNKLLLVTRLDPDKLNMVKDIVRAVNQIPDFSLTIVGGGLISYIRSVTNENIHVVGEKKEIASFYHDCDIVIGSGRSAVEGISFGKPVIVAGTRGLGGLVTPENYPRFRKIMFSGRFYGTINEHIPEVGLIAAVMALPKKTNLNQIIRENYRLVCDDFDCAKITRQFVNYLEKIIDRHDRAKSPEKILDMQPKFVSNCQLKRNHKKGVFEIVRMPSGKFLGCTDPGGRDFLRMCNGKNRVSDLINRYDSSGHKINRILYQLWRKKIIVFCGAV